MSTPKLYSPCFVLVFAADQALAASNPALGAELSLSSLSLSEPVTIKANFDDWETDRLEPGNRLYSKQIARAGFTFRHIHVGYTKQLYYFLNFSQDTALLHFLERNDRLRENKATFDLFLNANNAEAEGIFFGYTFDWRNLNINATMSFLDLQDLYYGEAYGFFDPALSQDNTTQVTIDYAYPEDRIFERPVDPPEGKGITLDVNIQYQWKSHRFAALIGEAHSDLYWNTAPGSRIEGNVSSLLSGDQAAIRYSHFRSRFHQRLPVHALLEYRYRLNSAFGAGVDYEKLDSKTWTKWIGDWHITQRWTSSVTWNSDDSIWGLQISHPYFLFGLESDSSDYRKSHYLKLQLMARAVF